MGYAIERAAASQGGGVAATRSVGGPPPQPVGTATERHLSELSQILTRLEQAANRATYIADNLFGVEPTAGVKGEVESNPLTTLGKLEAATRFIHQKIFHLENQLDRLGQL